MQRNIPIVYASTSGNVEFVCQRVQHLLSQSGAKPTLHRAEATEGAVITKAQRLVLATSTWAHGEINPYFEPLLKFIESNNMSQKIASFIGLGDTRYEPILFCEGINILDRAWGRAGGEKKGETLKMNNAPFNQMTQVDEWVSATFKGAA